LTDRLSKSQFDKLGERLKSDPIIDDDLRLLDEFRDTFENAYAPVDRAIRQLGLAATRRNKKTKESIIAKLRRGEVKQLSRMQDIAGCRIIVPNVPDQNRTLNSIHAVFPGATVVDRRTNPRNGYRAVHLIPRNDGKPVEIQLRTELQHLWARLSELLADRRDSAIKYGGGPEAWRVLLTSLSETLGRFEASTSSNHPVVPTGAPASVRDSDRQWSSTVAQVHQETIETYGRFLSMIEKLKPESDWNGIERDVLELWRSPGIDSIPEGIQT